MQQGCVRHHAAIETLQAVAMADQIAEIPILGKTKLILSHAALTENIIFRNRMQTDTSTSKNIQDLKGYMDMIKIFMYLRS